MKLSVFSKQLNEEAATQISLSKVFDASMLKDGKMLDQLADKIQSQGFPEKFAIPVKLASGVDLTLEYELYEKSINDSKSYHQVTFTYEYTRETTVKTRTLLRQAEKDDGDDEGEKYDEMYEELKYDMLHIIAEFGDKFTKVWGTTK
jgi:hypothetical protein